VLRTRYDMPTWPLLGAFLILPALPVVTDLFVFQVFFSFVIAILRLCNPTFPIWIELGTNPGSKRCYCYTLRPPRV
jgi:hypothetical protein